MLDLVTFADRYKREQRPPRVRLSPNGAIAINRSAWDLFGDPLPRHFRILVDLQAEVMALLPTTANNPLYLYTYAATPIQQGRAGCELRPTSFWRWYGGVVTKRYVATPDLIDGALAFSLKGSGVEAARQQAKYGPLLRARR
jgi:hypothetical protein